RNGVVASPSPNLGRSFKGDHMTAIQGTIQNLGARFRSWSLVPPEKAPDATLLLRLMAGSVFLWEGILKFVYANQGVGRFTKLGFPAPHFTATADGWFEIIGGILLLSGFLTRLVSVPFIIEMSVAMASTKIPL